MNISKNEPGYALSFSFGIERNGFYYAKVDIFKINNFLKDKIHELLAYLDYGC